MRPVTERLVLGVTAAAQCPGHPGSALKLLNISDFNISGHGVGAVRNDLDGDLAFITNDC